MGKMYRRWDKFEVQDVIARYLSGEDVQAIAEEYGRSVRVDGRKKEPTKNRMKWNRLSSK